MFAALLALVNSPSCGHTETVDKIQEVVANTTIENLGGVLLADRTTLRWPNIPSKKSSLRLDDDARKQYEKHFQLATDLFSKIKDFERTRPHEPTIENLSTTFRTYGNLGKVLYDSGGYTNLLLLDSMNRCALTQLSHALVNHPEHYLEYKPLLKQLVVPHCSNNEIVSVLAEESTIQEASKQVASIPKGGLLRFIVSLEQGSTNIRDLKPINTKTTYLLVNGGNPTLLGRFIDPLRIHQIALPGLVEYMRCGGTIDDIGMYAGNMPLFRNLMGDSLQKLTLEVTGDMRFSPVVLSSLIRFFKDTPYQSAFYTVAVE
jgi:hypothetical protein